MEYRKLIKLGKETFSVTLPKHWVTDHKLSKGDNIAIEEEGSILKIHAGEEKSVAEPKEITIDISEMTIDEIKRQILVAYINDFSIITLRGEFGKRTKEIRDIFHEFLALEVLELKNNSMTAKAFVDVSETNPLKIIRRIDTIIKTMFSEATQCLNKRKGHELLFEADDEVNRLYRFALKLITKGLQNPNMAKLWSYSQKDLALLILLLDRLEKIADRQKYIAKLFTSVKFNEEDKDAIAKKLAELEKNYRTAMTSFYKGDTTMANTVINNTLEEDRSILNNSFPCLSGEKDDCGCAIPVIFEYLARISTITEGIAHTVLDLHPTDVPKGTLLNDK